MVLGVWGSLLCLPAQEEGNFPLLTFAFSGLLCPGSKPMRTDPASPSPTRIQGQTTGTLPS